MPNSLCNLTPTAKELLEIRSKIETHKSQLEKVAQELKKLQEINVRKVQEELIIETLGGQAEKIKMFEQEILQNKQQYQEILEDLDILQIKYFAKSNTFYPIYKILSNDLVSLTLSFSFLSFALLNRGILGNGIILKNLPVLFASKVPYDAWPIENEKQVNEWSYLEIATTAMAFVGFTSLAITPPLGALVLMVTLRLALGIAVAHYEQDVSAFNEWTPSEIIPIAATLANVGYAIRKVNLFETGIILNGALVLYGLKKLGEYLFSVIKFKPEINLGENWTKEIIDYTKTLSVMVKIDGGKELSDNWFSELKKHFELISAFEQKRDQLQQSKISQKFNEYNLQKLEKQKIDENKNYEVIYNRIQPLLNIKAKQEELAEAAKIHKKNLNDFDEQIAELKIGLNHPHETVESLNIKLAEEENRHKAVIERFAQSAGIKSLALEGLAVKAEKKHWLHY